MKKSQIKVFFAAGVVALFLLSGCVSGILHTSQSTMTGASQQKSIVTKDDAVITCYVGGVPYSQAISYESGAYLKELFSVLATANAHDPSSAETRQLQQQILGYAEQQGLLPAGVSADVVFASLEKQGRSFATRHVGGRSVLSQGASQEFFCNFVSTGEGSAFPIIILPRFIPFIMTPIPRLFVGWKTDLGITSVGGLLSRTGFIASGQQQGLALGFWGIGFSIFLPPVMGYGMFGYALFAKVTAENMEFWPPNYPPEITQTDPADGQQMIPLSTAELRFSIDDENGDLMSYNVTTEPDIGSGDGGLKPGGVYSIPVSGLESLTTYTWHISLTDGKETVEKTLTFTTEPVAPVISNLVPADDERDVPMNLPQLQFALKDYQGDAMEYTVETSPDIGSVHETGVHDGTYTVPISGMVYGALYRWYVNATDGTHWTRKAFIFETGYPSQYDPFEFGWQYRKQITIDHLNVEEDLLNFPVLIKILDDDLRQKAQPNGDDILFMNDVGVANRLNYEIESYDGASGALVAWVNISQLSSYQDTVFYLYYGNANCLSQQRPQSTWDAQYKSVWHMNSASGSIIDSTANHHDGTVSSMSYQAAGKIGYGIEDDGTGYVDFGDQTEYEAQYLTYEVWSIHDNSARALDGGLAKGRVFGDYTSYSVQIAWHLGESSYSVIFTDGTVNSGVDDTTDLTDWNYFVGTHDGATGTTSLYINGDFKDSQTQIGKTIDYSQSQNNFKLGGRDAGIYSIDGRVDEVRISTIARSSGWIRTCYQNQNYPSDFINVGPEEPHP